MNRQQAKDLLPIIQAFAEGKTIQFYYLKGLDEKLWRDIPDEDVKFSYHPTRYRIKPEPKYRPFKDVNECWQEMQKHQPFGWLKHGKMMFNIITVTTDGIIIHKSTGNSWYNFTNSFVLTFADGDIFGIKE